MKENENTIAIKPIYIVMFFLSMLVTSCDKSEKSELNHIVLSLDWTPNAQHTGFYVAQKLGYYAEEGLELEIVQPHASSVTQLVATRKVDFGLTSGYSLLRVVDQGLPVKAIASILSEHTSSFYSLPQRPLRKVEDFVGATYGGWASPLVDGIFATMMRSVGEEPTAITQYISSSNDLLSLLASGQVDFIWGYDGVQLVEAQLRNMDVVVLPLGELDVLEQGSFAPPEPVIITHDDNLQQNKDVVRAFLRASRKGYEYSIDFPAEAANILIESVPEIDPDLVRASQLYLSPLYAKGVSEWGVNDKEKWQQFADWLFEAGLIDRTLVSDDFIWQESYAQQ